MSTAIEAIPGSVLSQLPPGQKPEPGTPWLDIGGPWGKIIAIVPLHRGGGNAEIIMPWQSEYAATFEGNGPRWIREGIETPVGGVISLGTRLLPTFAPNRSWSVLALARRVGTSYIVGSASATTVGGPTVHARFSILFASLAITAAVAAAPTDRFSLPGAGWHWVGLHNDGTNNICTLNGAASAAVANGTSTIDVSVLLGGRRRDPDDTGIQTANGVGLQLVAFFSPALTAGEERAFMADPYRAFREASALVGV